MSLVSEKVIGATVPPPKARSGRGDALRARTRTMGIGLVSILVTLAVWQALSAWFDIPLLFPSATTTLAHFWSELLDGTLARAAVASMARILAGFAIGSVLGGLLGLLLGLSFVGRAICEPYVQFFRFIPPLAWFAPVLLWFGTGETGKVLLIVYTTIFVVALSTMAGVAAVPRNKLRMAASFGASRWQSFKHVTTPASLPYVFNGMRIAMGNSFMTVVAAEMLAASQGLGYHVNNGVIFLDTPSVFSGIIALGILGFVTDRIFRRLAMRFGGRYIR